MYLQLCGVISPSEQHLFMSGQTPQGTCTSPGGGIRDSIALYTLLPSGYTVLSALPS